MTTHGPQPSDAELLRRARRDPEAFGMFYDRHGDAVLAYFMRRTACPQTALDLAAETFAAAFTARNRFTDRGIPATAWLFGIARNKLGRFARSQRVETRAQRRLGMERIEHHAAELDRVEALVDLSPIAERLDQAIASLSPPVALAVRLRVAEELPYADVADRLGCSEGAARVRVSRGLSHLATVMEAS